MTNLQLFHEMVKCSMESVLMNFNHFDFQGSVFDFQGSVFDFQGSVVLRKTLLN